jgi:hypothetical protein
MGAELHRLQTDPHALWAIWRDARLALIAHPTPARFDACLEAFRPYYIKLVGKGWQDGIEAAMAEERQRCGEIVSRGRVVQGGQHAPPAG